MQKNFCSSIPFCLSWFISWYSPVDATLCLRKDSASLQHKLRGAEIWVYAVHHCIPGTENRVWHRVGTQDIFLEQIYNLSYESPIVSRSNSTQAHFFQEAVILPSDNIINCSITSILCTLF